MRRPLRGLLTLCCALLTACSTSRQTDEILLGATLPLTGKESRAGLYFKNGYTLAVDEANAAGGVMVKGLKRRLKVRLELLDDKSDSSTAAQLAEYLVNVTHVHALLGTYDTKLVLAQSVVAERLQIPYVNGGGAASEIFHRDFQWVFGLLSSVEAMAGTFMDWVAVEQDAGRLPRPVRIALVWENTAHGQDFRNGIAQRADATPNRYVVALERSLRSERQGLHPAHVEGEGGQRGCFLLR